MKLQKLPLLAAVLGSLSLFSLSQAEDVKPVADPGALMPAFGTVSTRPSEHWDDGLAAGNGNMGAMLYGGARRDTILLNHCKLWLPSGANEQLPKAGDALEEMRKIIGEKNYDEGQRFFLEKARKSGWGGSLIWTDVFHPGFFLNFEQTLDGDVTDFARVENFSSGEVYTQWKTKDGDYGRRMIVSKADNTLVTTSTGPKGKVSLKFQLQKVESDLIIPSAKYENGWITLHNVYTKGKGGYDAAIRVINNGGTQTADAGSVTVTGADSVTLLMRILPFRTPLPSSQSWITDPKNPDFTKPYAPADRQAVQVAGKVYNPRWMADLRADLQGMSKDYGVLQKAHSAIWSKYFDRVSIDLNGSPEERKMSSEAILDKARQEQKLSPALLERMYYGSRYIYMCAAGPQTPPCLYGIWSGTWRPEWSGDYTTDTNVQLATEYAYSGNLAEFMGGYFYLWNSFLPDFRANAQAIYGARGIMIGSRHSNNGLALHWDQSWPGNQWTPGAAWLAHWYYDYYQYTGDVAFLKNTAIPWMKETALFWEDFLKGTEGKDGKFVIRPSFSAENGYGDNTSQDIEITHQLFTNLIAGCEKLGIERDSVPRWKAILAKLPPLLINEQGQLKEWSNPNQGERNNHRHLMHLYGAFESQQFSEEADPKIFAAAKVALENRIKETSEEATHGFMHMGLAAVGLGLGDLAFERVEQLAKRRSIYPSFLFGHFGGPRVPCTDGNGSTPEIVNRMIYNSKMGELSLLPAVPKALPKGTLSGVRARGNVTINKLSWDMAAGTCDVALTSGAAQVITLKIPATLEVKSVKVDGQEMPASRKLNVPAGKAVAVSVKFAPVL